MGASSTLSTPICQTGKGLFHFAMPNKICALLNDFLASSYLDRFRFEMRLHSVAGSI